jgi:glycosyltransferase involved in cell wall biosynthesis
MKIWILNHYASPPDRPAGTRHYEFGRVLAAQGHDVTIFASGFSHVTLMEERLQGRERTRIERIDGVRFVWVRTIPYSGNDARRLLNMLSYALATIRVQVRMSRPDVIVGSNVHLAAVVAAWLIGCARRVPFVFEVRDLWPQTLIDVGALQDGGVPARVLRELERFLYNRARVVISLLPGACDYITRLGVPKQKVVYVPNGIADFDEPERGLDDGALELMGRIETWRQAGYLVAGYAGSHAQTNSIDTLVEAALVLRDRGAGQYAFVFVGAGTEKAKAQQLAKQYGLDNILFWLPVPKYTIPALLGALDVTLYSLRDVAVAKYGLSSNKLFSYLASGRPVVLSCAVEDTPVSASGGGICVPAESPKDVADALEQLSAVGQEGRDAIGELGRRWVYQHHGATALARRFLDALAVARR